MSLFSFSMSKSRGYFSMSPHLLQYYFFWMTFGPLDCICPCCHQIHPRAMIVIFQFLCVSSRFIGEGKVDVANKEEGGGGGGGVWWTFGYLKLMTDVENVKVSPTSASAVTHKGFRKCHLPNIRHKHCTWIQSNVISAIAPQWGSIIQTLSWTQVTTLIVMLKVHL